MEIREYWHILRRRAWIPLVLIVVMSGTTATLTYLSRPEYTATATVLAKSQGSATPALNFQDIAISNTLVLRVRNQLHLAEGVDSVINRISVTGDKSNLFRITVKDSEPDQAARIANAVAQEAAKLYKQLAAGTDTSAAQDLQSVEAAYRAQYVGAAKAVLDFQQQHSDVDKTKDTTVRAELIGRQLDQQATGAAYSSFEADVVKARIDESVNARNFEARVVDEAAAKPDTTGRYLKIAYAAALALVGGIGMIFALEYLDTSVREPEEVELLVGAPVIGLIPRGSTRTLRSAMGSA